MIQGSLYYQTHRFALFESPKMGHSNDPSQLMVQKSGKRTSSCTYSLSHYSQDFLYPRCFCPLDFRTNPTPSNGPVGETYPLLGGLQTLQGLTQFTLQGPTPGAEPGAEPLGWFHHPTVNGRIQKNPSLKEIEWPFLL